MHAEPLALHRQRKTAIGCRKRARRHGLDRECTAFVQVIRTHAVKQIRIGAVFGLRLRRGQGNQNKIIVLFALFEKAERIFSIAVQARAHRPYKLLLRCDEIHILCGAVSEQLFRGCGATQHEHMLIRACRRRNRTIVRRPATPHKAAGRKHQTEQDSGGIQSCPARSPPPFHQFLKEWMGAGIRPSRFTKSAQL